MKLTDTMKLTATMKSVLSEFEPGAPPRRKGELPHNTLNALLKLGLLEVHFVGSHPHYYRPHVK